MLRRTFILGGTTALAAPSLLTAQNANKVIVIGAGVAGMTAAYHLKSYGVDVTVLEASNRWGGRVKRLDGFTNVPLDLGAEWIHTDPTVLGQILGEGDTDMGVETIAYRPETYQFWNRGKLRNFDVANNFYEETKFKNTTWFGFFEKFMLPTVRSSISLNSPVASIDHSSDGVTVRTIGGQSVSADRVIVTVPISQLQQKRIRFAPDVLKQLGGLNDVAFGKGYKVFITFAERFYPDMLFFGSRLQAFTTGYDAKIYYNAAFQKPTDTNILGLFNVDHDNLPRVELSDEDIIDDVLNELTDIYGDVVRRHFQQARVQNWSSENFIGGSYSMTNSSDEWLSDILAPVEGKIYFAGEALGGDNQSTVHGAAFSAQNVLDQIFAA